MTYYYHDNYHHYHHFCLLQNQNEPNKEKDWDWRREKPTNCLTNWIDAKEEKEKAMHYGLVMVQELELDTKTLMSEKAPRVPLPSYHYDAAFLVVGS